MTSLDSPRLSALFCSQIQEQRPLVETVRDPIEIKRSVRGVESVCRSYFLMILAMCWILLSKPRRYENEWVFN